MLRMLRLQTQEISGMTLHVYIANKNVALINLLGISLQCD